MKHDRGGICGAKVSSWSSVTPRSRTTGEKIKWGKSAAMAERSSFASCCRVPNQINWVFDGLSLKRLVDIQVSKTSKVLLIAKTAEVALEEDSVGRPGCHRHTVTQHKSGSEKRAYLGGVNDVKKRTQNRTLRKTTGAGTHADLVGPWTTQRERSLRNIELGCRSPDNSKW